MFCASACDAAWKNLAALCGEAFETVRVFVIDFCLVRAEPADLLAEESFALAARTFFFAVATFRCVLCIYFEFDFVCSFV